MGYKNYTWEQFRKEYEGRKRRSRTPEQIKMEEGKMQKSASSIRN